MLKKNFFLFLYSLTLPPKSNDKGNEIFTQQNSKFCFLRLTRVRYLQYFFLLPQFICSSMPHKFWCHEGRKTTGEKFNSFVCKAREERYEIRLQPSVFPFLCNDSSGVVVFHLLSSSLNPLNLGVLYAYSIFLLFSDRIEIEIKRTEFKWRTGSRLMKFKEKEKLILKTLSWTQILRPHVY